MLFNKNIWKNEKTEWTHLFRKRYPPSKNIQPQPVPHSIMLLLAILIGISTGFIAVALNYLISIIHNLIFLWHWSFSYDTLRHTPKSPWGWAIIFVPVYGAIIVVFLISKFAPEAKGHGVPEIIEAVRFKGAYIRPIVAVIKALASAVSIGTGGAVGREGPIAQIGSTVGAVISHYAGLPLQQRVTLVAMGAGGGIAAAFNSPFSGFLFSIEIILVVINAASMFPVAISCATAAYVARFFVTNTPLFPIPLIMWPAHHLQNSLYLLWFIPFGALLGLVSLFFTASIYQFETWFDKMPGNYLSKHMFGMLLVGGGMELFMLGSGRYYIQGMGYATIYNCLQNMLGNPLLLLVLAVAKTLATSITLGSGASGGVFSPALFVGATFGAMCGICLNYIMPGLHMNPAVFAVVGMGAMVGGMTGAVATGIVMPIEIISDHQLILPMMISVGISYCVRHFFVREGIYMQKLYQQKLYVMEGLQTLVTAKESLQQDHRFENESHHSRP